MLLGRFLVGTGMGLGPPVASLYITEVCSWCFSSISDLIDFNYSSPYPLMEILI
jgi:hypothetical protein